MTVTLKTPPIAGLLRNVSGMVLGPDGVAQSDGETVVYAEAGKIKTYVGGSTERRVLVDRDGRFELRDVPAGHKLRLYAATEGRTLAAADVFEIPDDPDWADYVAVNLVATHSASVVVRNEDGDVVPGRHFSIDPIVEGEAIWSVDMSGWTDENGLLELDGIVPGLEYYLTSVEHEGGTRPSPEAISEMLRLKMVLIPLEPR